MITLDSQRCDSCGTCVAVCPVAAISMEKQPCINSSCIGCQKCVLLCPWGALSAQAKAKA
ncbi:4Fe-4S binding protein [Chitinivibrio alkaliphilus]|uniref:4Fe-4S ferredoxin-type domain-containing protein n=1 Tax=Chitinivibrio alkaliphilus ACht1 TaxID=1313304 RepID=U7DCF6_9BACT|nr:4Fe-4S binding protein [Chitinivibrio alkaliphilus]ERP32110.1 hypothetical protein CALK_0831 [Chitinivibrio alkaliphilus ACht1]